MSFEKWVSQWLDFITPQNLVRVMFVFIAVLVFYMIMRFLIAREKNKGGFIRG